MLPLYQWHVYASGIRQASECAAGFTLGVPERRVNELLSSGPCAYLETSELHDSDGGTTWVVRTPMVFGARNWYVRIEVRDDIVVAVRFRTADSADEHPKGAPPDLAASP